MNQLGESLPNFIFAVVNLDPIVLEKRWNDGESWPYDFVEKVNRGEDLRWVGSLVHAFGIPGLLLKRKMFFTTKSGEGGFFFFVLFCFVFCFVLFFPFNCMYFGYV